MKSSVAAAVVSVGVVLVSIVGCSEAKRPPPPSAPNQRAADDAGGPKPSTDGGQVFIDAGALAMDAGFDTEPDAGLDAGLDTELDAGLDAGLELGLDGGAGLIYPGDRTQSPIDQVVAQHLRSIAARGSGQAMVFSKVGDSISTNTSGVAGGRFLNCFDGTLEGTVSWEINVYLGPYSALAPTIDYFRTVRIGADDSWTRASLCTQQGRMASWAVTGSPSPLDQELTAAQPRYAVVMYGSNDIGYLSWNTLADGAERYERNMRLLTDRLLAQGVIPLLTTMPPDGDYFAQVPVFAGVVRAIAQGRQVPLIDYYRELMALGPPYGLGSDAVHPTCARYNTCCWFDAVSLSQHGINVRNLITLQSLDRMRQVFDLGVQSLDPQAPRMAGDGSETSPFVISQVPFGELRDLRSSGPTAVGRPSCPGAPAVAGRQNLYRLELTRTTSLRVLVLDGGARAQRVSLLSSPSLTSCLKSDPRLIATTLAAGTYYLAVNALSASGGAEYNLSVSECIAGDPSCVP